MGPRWLKIVLGGGLGLILAVGLFASGIAVGAAFSPLPLLSGRQTLSGAIPTVIAPLAPANPAPTPLTSSDREALMQPFWEAWAIVHDQFVDQPVDDTKLMRGAISGMLQSLGDQHTSYMDPEEYKQANISLEGQYEGIGAWVDTTSDYLTIIAPMVGSPAERAGLQPGDKVIAVDGEDMTGMDGSLVISRVLGPAGTTVHLTIARPGVAEPLEFDVTREHIDVPSLESRMLDGQIGYVHLYTFGQGTADELHNALSALKQQNPKGLILDLRGNGGGFLETAIQVASEFIPNGVVMTERFGDGKEQVYQASGGGLATDIPMVVLINGGTASASEIVAGAIRDHQRGELIGETSYGKGSVQNWVPLQGDNGAVRVTVARWYTPNNMQINGIGLTPDIEVRISPDDLAAGKDTQLLRAIEELTKKLAGSGS
jgi:carboxyl-terminal processing protease